MVIIETPTFTRQIMALLSDDEYAALQLALALRPDLGTLIQGSGGLRKVRWSVGDRGKRGGMRAIYYWVVAQDCVLMLLAYSKSESDDLTADQLKALRRIIREEYP